MVGLRLAILSALSAAAITGAVAAPVGVFADDRTMGSPKAPVTVIEYAAPTCPHCAHFAETVFPQLRKTYIDVGKVYYVLRIYPLTPYDGAVAGMAACMPQNRYFEFLDLAFQKQGIWDPNGYNVPDVHAGLVELGRLAGMKPEQVERCRTDAKELDRVNRIAQDGEKKYGVNSVPTLIVNGTAVPPSEAGWPQLSARIETLLKSR